MQASESAIFCGDCFGHLRIARGLDVKTNDGKFEIAKLMYVLYNFTIIPKASF